MQRRASSDRNWAADNGYHVSTRGRIAGK
ncbi:hypothetical protein GS434_20350 [Rhodococcus hoagii]|nr:hypothetical protein [Prescottella equi]